MLEPPVEIKSPISTTFVFTEAPSISLPVPCFYCPDVTHRCSISSLMKAACGMPAEVPAITSASGDMSLIFSTKYL